MSARRSRRVSIAAASTSALTRPRAPQFSPGSCGRSHFQISGAMSVSQRLDETGDSSLGGKTMGERLRWPLLIGGPVIVIAIAAWFVLTGGRSQSTDDSYVQASRTPISANVSARVVELDVKDN